MKNGHKSRKCEQNTKIYSNFPKNLYTRGIFQVARMIKKKKNWSIQMHIWIMIYNERASYSLWIEMDESSFEFKICKY